MIWGTSMEVAAFLLLMVLVETVLTVYSFVTVRNYNLRLEMVEKVTQSNSELLAQLDVMGLQCNNVLNSKPIQPIGNYADKTPKAADAAMRVLQDADPESLDNAAQILAALGLDKD